MTLTDVEFNIRDNLEEQDDVMRCLRNLILTPAGSVPLDRDFGIDQSFLGQPLNVAQNTLAVEIMGKAARYEPRAAVLEVRLTSSVDGQIKAEVVIANG